MNWASTIVSGREMLVRPEVAEERNKRLARLSKAIGPKGPSELPTPVAKLMQPSYFRHTSEINTRIQWEADKKARQEQRFRDFIKKS